MGKAKRKAKVSFKKLEHNGNVLELRKPIKVDILEYGDGYLLAYEELEVFAIGETKEECKEHFQEEFFALMDTYLVPDEGLTVKAIRIKRGIEAIVAKQ